MGNVVSNSSCLISLENIGHIDLLPKCFQRVIVPMAVSLETGLNFDWLDVCQVTQIIPPSLNREPIGAGEREAISLAFQLQKAVLLDDARARRIANKLGLKFIGTIGVIVKAKKLGLLPNVKDLLEQLQDVGFHLSSELIQRALAESGETE